MIPELFTIMLLKLHHYTPEPRFQTRNGESLIRAIIKLGIHIDLFEKRHEVVHKGRYEKFKALSCCQKSEVMKSHLEDDDDIKFSIN